MVEEFAVVIRQMPAEVLLVAKSAMAFRALERPVLVVYHFDVAFQVATAGEAGFAQITRVWPLVSVGLEVGFQRPGFHDPVAGQTLDAGAFPLSHDDRPHLDATLAVLFEFLKVIRILREERYSDEEKRKKPRMVEDQNFTVGTI